MFLNRVRLKRPVFTPVVISFFALCSAVQPAQTPKPAVPSAPPAAQTSSPPVPVLQNATGPKDSPLFPKDMVIMTVGEHRFTVADFDRIMESLPPQQRAFYSGPGKRNFAEQFSQLLIFADEARRQGLDADPVVKQKLEIVSDQILSQSLGQRINDNLKISDTHIEKYYADHASDFEEVKASHILIRPKDVASPKPQGKKDLTEEEAKAKAEEIYKQVMAPGADFAAIARAESYDQGSATQGGDLGFIRRGRMVPPFETAAFSLNAGEISPPVRSPFGYHIIKVFEKKKRSLQEVKTEIETAMRPEKMNEALEALKKSVKVEFNAQFFPAPPPPAPPTAPAAPPTGTAPPPKTQSPQATPAAPPKPPAPPPPTAEKKK